MLSRRKGPTMKRIAVCIATLAVGVSIAVAVLGAPKRASASNSIPLPGGGSLRIAPLAAGGYQLAVSGSSETLDVQGSTIADSLGDGTVERTTYHGSEADLWRDLGLRFGVTKAAVQAAAAGARTVSATVKPAPGEAGETETAEVHDYAGNAARLRAAFAGPIGTLSPAPKGFTLAKTTTFRLDRNSQSVKTSIDVGPVAHVVYSANPSRLGLGDSEILVDSAPLGSSFAAGDRSLAASPGSALIPGVAAGSAVRIPSGQIIIFTTRLCVALTPQGDVSDAMLEAAARSLKELG
jgi:hypothetical protein